MTQEIMSFVTELNPIALKDAAMRLADLNSSKPWIYYENFERAAFIKSAELAITAYLAAVDGGAVENPRHEDSAPPQTSDSLEAKSKVCDNHTLPSVRMSAEDAADYLCDEWHTVDHYKEILSFIKRRDLARDRAITRELVECLEWALTNIYQMSVIHSIGTSETHDKFLEKARALIAKYGGEKP